MQLFQPTNITPDIRGAFGNGVVHNAEYTGLTVTWQVNGNTAMSGFQIDVYENDEDSTLLFSTTKLTTNCPFYGTDAMGNPVPFSYTISASDCSDNGIITSNDSYKLKITQWWGTGNDSVTQQSPSVFYIYESFAVGVEDANTGQSLDGETLTGREVSAVAGVDRQFGGPGSNVGMLWYRWVLQNVTDPADVYTVADTGKVYGSPRIAFSYDGLFSGETYKLYLSGETGAGELIDGLPPETFSVSYPVDSTGIDLFASKACAGESAVKVSWGRLVYIPAVTTGVVDYGINTVVMKSGASLGYTTENGSAMSMEPDWSVIWKGTLNGTATLCKLTFDDSSYAVLQYTVLNGGPTGNLYWGYLGYTVGNVFFNVNDWSQATVILSKDQVVCKFNGNGGLYPDDQLTPDDYLYPSDDPNGTIVIGRDVENAYTPFAGRTIVSVEVGGPQTLDYLQIIDHTPTYQEMTGYLSSDFVPTFDIGTRFLLDHSSPQGSAGSLYGDVSDYSGARLYRQTYGSGELEIVGEFAVTVRSVLDYAAPSQGGPFTYYLFLDPHTVGVNQARAVSNPTDPCFWNWTVLDCEEQSNGTYSVVRSYVFGNNLTSGAVSNNNQPNILNNFTRYPLVQIAPSNYKSGSLVSLIGVIDYAGGRNDYVDSSALRDAILDLSTTKNTLFLKNRKGDVWRIRPGGEVTMETMDNTREQAQSMTFPWVESGSADGVSIYQVLS